MDDADRLQGALGDGHRAGAVDKAVRGALVQPRIVVGLLLIAAGVTWAIVRGLESYGVVPPAIAYDIDQPPLLLVLVGGWLVYRSRGR